jgi:hypothetical protein
MPGLGRPGKAAANEKKHPYVVELAIARDRLDVELSRHIMQFHKSRQIQPLHGRIIIRQRKLIYRWCFDDLLVARAFVEQFGGEFCKAGI